jgi:hypothetical protein
MLNYWGMIIKDNKTFENIEDEFEIENTVSSIKIYNKK